MVFDKHAGHTIAGGGNHEGLVESQFQRAGSEFLVEVGARRIAEAQVPLAGGQASLSRERELEKQTERARESKRERERARESE
jgi:hypothetical protein